MGTTKYKGYEFLSRPKYDSKKVTLSERSRGYKLCFWDDSESILLNVDDLIDLKNQIEKMLKGEE